jgi:hypothetical protein
MQDARTFVNTHGVAHLGKNIRRYKWTTFDGQAKEGMFGQLVNIKPHEGKFIHADEDWSLFKTAASEFMVIATSLLGGSTFNPEDKVLLKFHQTKDFDRLAADGSEDPSTPVGDGGGISSRSIMLTGAKVEFPVKWEGRYLQRNKGTTDTWTVLQNPYLQDMVKQLEDIRADRHRNLASVLVDAGATRPSFVDPTEENSYNEDKTLWPSITVSLNNTKFSGTFTLRYNRASDDYETVFAPDNGPVEVMETVYVTDLADIFLDKIEDGSWRNVRATLLKAAPKKRAVAVAEPA